MSIHGRRRSSIETRIAWEYEIHAEIDSTGVLTAVAFRSAYFAPDQHGSGKSHEAANKENPSGLVVAGISPC